MPSIFPYKAALFSFRASALHRNPSRHSPEVDSDLLEHHPGGVPPSWFSANGALLFPISGRQVRALQLQAPLARFVMQSPVT
jgi:hypothetical protein